MFAAPHLDAQDFQANNEMHSRPKPEQAVHPDVIHFFYLYLIMRQHNDCILGEDKVEVEEIQQHVHV
jgi:hypothetical protein